MKALTEALAERLQGMRLESVQMPDKHTVVFTIGRLPDALLLSIDPAANQLALVPAPSRRSSQLRHPMRDLLASRLVGGTILSLWAPLGERVVILDVVSRNRIGDRTGSQLVLELFGSRADLALVERSEVVESLRRRRLEPRDPYQPPPAVVDPNLPGVGGAPLVLREFRHLAADDKEAATAFWRRIWAEPGQFSPVRLEGLSPPFYPVPLSHRPGAQPSVPDFLAAMSEAALEARRTAQLEARRRVLLSEQEAALVRLERQEQDLQAALQASAQAAVLRREAEALLTVVTSLPAGASQFTYTDWEHGDQRTVELDATKPPTAVAEAWFKEARRITVRARRAATLLPALQAKVRAAAAARDQISTADHLPDAPPAQGSAATQRKTTSAAHPYHTCRTPAGHQLRVGRNQQGNDLLLRLARPGDLWLHARGIPGSHVILSTQGGVGETDKEAAALLAAHFSKGRQARTVLVDCTLRRHVRKPAKAAPGHVVFDHEETLQVNPEGSLLAFLLSQLESDV